MMRTGRAGQGEGCAHTAHEAISVRSRAAALMPRPGRMHAPIAGLPVRSTTALGNYKRSATQIALLSAALMRRHMPDFMLSGRGYALGSPEFVERRPLMPAMGGHVLVIQFCFAFHALKTG